jgi:hypothetical protein
MLVPRFADHCFIDLFEEGALIRRVQRNAGDWMPPPGTWARVGEQIRYPEGHFCQMAMAHLDTIVADLTEEPYPAPSAQSLTASQEAGLTSILATPLYSRGVLLGVMSLALSGLTDRTGQHYATADRHLIGAVASRVATAVDDAITVPGTAPDRAAPHRSCPPHLGHNRQRNKPWRTPQAPPRRQLMRKATDSMDLRRHHRDPEGNHRPRPRPVA